MCTFRYPSLFGSSLPARLPFLLLATVPSYKLYTLMASLLSRAAVMVAMIVVPTVVMATSYDPQTTGPFADSLCNFLLKDVQGNTYRYDLRSIAGKQLSIVNQYNYSFVPCGVAAPECVPSFGQLWPLSSAYQIEGGGAAGNCYSSKDGQTPCTPACEGLSVGPPLHQLLDITNGYTGGLMSTFAGMWTQNSDGQKCGNVDPVTGKEMGRSLQINHFCDPSIPAGTVKTQSQSEYPTCHYVLNIVSSASCGINVTSPPPLPVPGPPTPVWAPGAGPFAPYLCNPNLTDSSGKNWAFGFSQLFNPSQDYSFTGSDGTVYNFNVCGYTSTVCNPFYSVGANWGGVVATWGPVTPPPQGAVCYLANGTSFPCTDNCRTLGAGAPLFSLTDPTNGAGGVTMALQGEFANADEPTVYQCAYDPYNNPVPNSVAVQFTCDSNTPVNKLVTTGVTTGPSPCTYVIQAKTGAACPQ